MLEHLSNLTTKHPLSSIEIDNLQEEVTVVKDKQQSLGQL